MAQIITHNGLKKATAVNLYVALAHPTDADSLVSNPAQAAGDWTISKDGGSFSNLATLPSVAPASSYSVKIPLSGTEMNADHILIVGKDQTATEEWQAMTICITTTEVTVDNLVRSATPANELEVDADGRVDIGAIDGSSSVAGALALAVDTTNNVVKADAVRISGDSTAADNAEAMFDGTGYAGGTIKLGVNVSQWASQTAQANGTTNLPMVDLDSVDGSTAKATAFASAIDSANNWINADIKAIDDSSAAVANMQDDYDGTGYAGGTVPRDSNMTKISGDATAADTLESYCDGNGNIPVDVVKISGDATAADNAEAAFDGNGYGFVGCTVPIVTSITNPVDIDTTQVVAENTDALTVGWCLTIAAGAQAHRVVSDAGSLVLYASDGVTPRVTRTQTDTELGPA